MERLFSPVRMVSISDNLKERALEMKYIGDLSDLGNEIGIVVGNLYLNMNQEEIDLFVSGFKHGVSLTKNSD
jgi:hypothetical protein